MKVDSPFSFPPHFFPLAQNCQLPLLFIGILVSDSPWLVRNRRNDIPSSRLLFLVVLFLFLYTNTEIERKKKKNAISFSSILEKKNLTVLFITIKKSIKIAVDSGREEKHKKTLEGNLFFFFAAYGVVCSLSSRDV